MIWDYFTSAGGPVWYEALTNAAMFALGMWLAARRLRWPRRPQLRLPYAWRLRRRWRELTDLRREVRP